MKKVLVTDLVHHKLIEGLQELGYEVEYDKAVTLAQLDPRIHDYSGLIINSKIKMTSERMAMAKKLEFIGRLGSGLEIIDQESAKKHNVHVYNSPEGNRNAVAEHAIGMLLCLTNNLLKGDAEVRQKVWNREANRGIEIKERVVGIIGLGNTGRSLARKLSGWAQEIIYYDPYVLDVPEDIPNIRSVTIDQLRVSSDIISLHVPLTSETEGMIDRDFLSSCKKGLIIINTSRGPVINTSDLLDSLQSGHLFGACLDVFENEKPHSFTPEEGQLYDELYKLQNVVLSPHVAGWTDSSLRKIAEVLLEKISKGFQD